MTRMSRAEYVRTIEAMIARPRPVFGAEVEIVTIEGVELCAAGVDIPASTGPVDITREHLEAMATQHDDPAVRQPIVKITHLPAMFGHVAWGRLVNLRVNDNGTKLIGDIECAKGVAELIKHAWPDRSVEFNFNETTQSGTTHLALLHAVAVLGSEEPAIQGLEGIEDVAAMFGVDPKTVVPIAAQGAPASNRVVLSTTIDRLYGAYSANVPQNDRPEPYMWTREIWLDDNTEGWLISEGEDSGRLYRIPFKITADEVTFGPPVEVVTQYVEASVATTIAASSGRTPATCLARNIPRNTDRGASLRGTNDTAVSQPGQGGPMNPEQLRQALGLPTDATDAQVAEALTNVDAAWWATQAAAIGGGGGQNGDGDGSPTTNADGTPATGNAPPAPPAPPADPAPAAGDLTAEGIAAAIAAGRMVAVDAGALQALQGQAAHGTTARQTQVDAENEVALSTAVRKGRITPDSRQHYAPLLAAKVTDAAAMARRAETLKLLEALPTVLPTDGIEPGSGGSPEVAASADALYESVWGKEDNVVPIGAARSGRG